MANKKVIRCQSDNCGNKDKSNILLAYDSNSIYVKCRDWDCKRWNKISFIIPDTKIDLTKAGIIVEVLSDDYHLHIENQPLVVKQ